MKIILRSSALLVFVVSMTGVVTVVAEDPKPFGDIVSASPGNWEFVPEHSDEFDSNQIDTKKWDINTEDWGTWSWQPENTVQNGGSMHLRMVQEDHQRGGNKLAYKSGIARQHQTVTYGYFEARVKGCKLFPGACPSFWLHSKGPQLRYSASDGETVAYSEIDIIELQQGEWDQKTKKDNGPEVIDCNLHNVLIKNGERKWMRPGTHPETNKNEFHAPFDPRDDYHVYAAENTPDWVIWYIDGKEVARRPNLYWHLPMHITLSLGLRRPFENYKDGQRVAILEATTKQGFPTHMSVDYVRVWQNPSVAEPQLAASGQKQSPKQQASRQQPSKKKAATDWTKEEYIAREKANWKKNGWNWNQDKVESNFDEVDANQDGIASGSERQAWFAKKKAGSQPTAPAQKQTAKQEQSPQQQGNKKKSASDWTKVEYIAKEKANWEKNGWNWNQEKVESNFEEVDANQDGVASGSERQAWFAKKKAEQN